MGRYQKRDKMDGTSHADTWRKGTRAHQSYDSTRGHALSRLAKCVISLLPSPASRIIGSQTSAGLCPDCRGPATSVTRARSTLERTNQAPATRTIPSTRPKDANAPPSSLRRGWGALSPLAQATTVLEHPRVHHALFSTLADQAQRGNSPAKLLCFLHE